MPSALANDYYQLWHRFAIDFGERFCAIDLFVYHCYYINYWKAMVYLMNILIKDILAVLPDSVEVCSIYISDGIIASISVEPDYLPNSIRQSNNYI
jgi:hypothetical protein